MTEKKRQDWHATVARALPRHALLICRLYEETDWDAARALRQITRKRGVLMTVAGDPALARAIGADGLHLPSYQLKCPPRGPIPHLSAACHTRGDLKRAKDLGIPLRLVSPVFVTQSHKGAPCLGVHRFSRLIGDISGCIALGGVNSHTAKKLPRHKIDGFAAIRAWQDFSP